MIDSRGISIQRALTRNLLPSIEHKGEEKPLANGPILPKGGVIARNGFLFVFKGFSDHEKFIFHFPLSIANTTQSISRSFGIISPLEIPPRSSRDGKDEAKDQDRNQQLEDHDSLPVPLA